MSTNYVKVLWNRISKAANWSRPPYGYLNPVWNVSMKNFWTENDFNISLDIPSWDELDKDMQVAIVKAFAGLTLLDTEQGTKGMPLIAVHEKVPERAAVFSWFAGIEGVHAKFYSKVFQTLLSTEEISYYMDEFVQRNEYMQHKANKIVEGFYLPLLTRNPTPLMKYMAKVASVFLESFLFYSGFYLPLKLKSQGIIVQSATGIETIMRDESVHGNFTGAVAREEFDELSIEDQELAEKLTVELFNELMEVELLYTKELYEPLGMVDEVVEFLKFNANLAFMNLGMDEPFEEINLNPLVRESVEVSTENHDFFSMKTASYFKALNIQPITKETFNFARGSFGKFNRKAEKKARLRV